MEAKAFEDLLASYPTKKQHSKMAKMMNLRPRSLRGFTSLEIVFELMTDSLPKRGSRLDEVIEMLERWRQEDRLMQPANESKAA